MKPFFPYLKFLLKSTNQHGVHSPFVYDLVTKCFYSKKKAHLEQESHSKLQKMFLRILDYFEPETIWEVDDTSVEKSFTETFDLVCFIDPHLKNYKHFFPTINNDSVWLFYGIHINSENEKIWEEIKKHEKVTVTIDTFDLGLVFFREEQAKEHFTIRV